MSIQLMISEHPDVGTDYNPSLGEAVHKAVECTAICNSCADACVTEPMDMKQCVRTFMDCADVCEVTARIAMRRTGVNRELIRAQLAVCVRACETCADECNRHDNAHCRRCAQMCRETAVAARMALEALNAEVHAEA